VAPLSIAFVVPEIGEEASGPTYSVPRLASALASRGAHVELHVLELLEPPRVPGVDVHVYRRLPGPRILGLSPAFVRGVLAAARRSDLVHNNGLWMLPNIQGGLAARLAKTPLVYSPRGALASWALKHSEYKKRFVWRLGQGAAIRRSALLHATSEAEFSDIRRMGLSNPVAIIPNGIDVPEIARPARGPRRRLLFLGRIHPVKGIDLLLKVWAQVRRERPDWDLQIVGPPGPHEQSIRKLARELSLSDVDFAGPRYGADKLATYAAADLYVLPTHTENFGMTIAESLACGTPVVTTRGAPWAGLEREGCGFWIERSEPALTKALLRATEMSPVELGRCGARGRAWMLREFSWDGIAEKMQGCYDWVLGGSTIPDCVLT
jgi:glycosyltransferase involved in cell wall biosynthesis